MPYLDRMLVHQEWFPNRFVYQMDFISATQAYRIGRYAVDIRKPEACLKRAAAMGLGRTAAKTVREAEYLPAQMRWCETRQWIVSICVIGPQRIENESDRQGL